MSPETRLALLLAILAGAAPPLRAAEALIVVQRSPLAGLRYYEAPRLWPQLKPGERLELAREPDNPYDAGAIRVEWRGAMLGYLPRRDNAAVARQLDRGVALQARIVEAGRHRNGRARVEIEVVAPLASPGERGMENGK
ncbi:MAG TPA: HIRAN domain-containing protein [Burkholderiales bacterium]|nr:HIRAN domain-containing protein [Burkholderiales bacterium]